MADRPRSRLPCSTARRAGAGRARAPAPPRTPLVARTVGPATSASGAFSRTSRSVARASTSARDPTALRRCAGFRSRSPTAPPSYAATRGRRRTGRRSPPGVGHRRRGTPRGSPRTCGGARRRHSRAAANRQSACPFSSTTTERPSSRSRAAATNPAIPAPATVTVSAVRVADPLRGRGGDPDHCGSLQGERRLVLDVLDLDAVRPANERRQRVRGVDEVHHLDPALRRRVAVLVRRSDEHAEMVQERRVGFGSPSRAARGRLPRARPARPRRARFDGLEPVVAPEPGAWPRDPCTRKATWSRSTASPGRRGRRALAQLDVVTCRPGQAQTDAKQHARSRGPSASKRVSLPRRASSPPINVNASVSSITRRPSSTSREASDARPATQRAT